MSSPGLPQRLHASILEIALPSANSRSMVALFLLPGLRPPVCLPLAIYFGLFIYFPSIWRSWMFRSIS